MEDGTRLENIEGVKIPAGHPAYRVLANYRNRRKKEVRNKTA